MDLVELAKAHGNQKSEPIIHLYIYNFIYLIFLKGKVGSFLPHKITSLSIVRFLWFIFGSIQVTL
jgi:hypothetical protein